MGEISTAENVQAIKQTKILHLAGSVESKFLFDLSLMYCKTSWEELTKEFPNSFLAIVTTDKRWYITQEFENAMELVAPISESEALEQLKELGIDAVIPHMFCYEGMTTYRELMEKAGLKIMGNPSKVCDIAHHKQKTKTALRKASIRVPNGVYLTDISEAPEEFPFPCVVKPCDLDNSVGVTFCETKEQYQAALEHVFTLSKEILVEEYIPGEEIRCAVIETADKGLRALPMIKYHLDVPIRGTAQKLILAEDKTIKGYATKPHQVELPAKLNADQKAKIEATAKLAHKALGCELYSLYDFRVNEKEVVVLEACLFCSFSPKSVLPTLARAEGISATSFFQSLLEIRLKH